MKNRRILSVLLPALVLALSAAGIFALRALEMRRAPDPRITVVRYLEGLCSGDTAAAMQLMSETVSGLETEAGTQEGKMLAELIRSSRAYSITNCILTGYRTAEADVSVSCVNTEKLAEGFAAETDAALAEAVRNAARSEDIYAAGMRYKSDVLYTAFDGVLRGRAMNAGQYSDRTLLTLRLDYNGSEWKVRRNDTLLRVFSGFTAGETPDELAQAMFESAVSGAEYHRKHYSLSDAEPAPAPDAALYGETDDVSVIRELLESFPAQQLLDGQKTAWNGNIELLPGSVIRYYLDETILFIEWQEVTEGAIATLTELKLADGSQLRRKLAGDEYYSGQYNKASALAKEANAVMALSGDFYQLGDREYGIVVYNGKICRFDPEYADTCFINGEGELLFSHRGELTERTEAERFVEENGVRFSLCFGPVLIEDGTDVTPESYILGEINDLYARCGIGQLGETHYLTANINCRPNSQYYYLVKLKTLTELLQHYGCERAYALDGGQTAETIINGEYINDIQFGHERSVSDCICFTTALPEREEEVSAP